MKNINPIVSIIILIAVALVVVLLTRPSSLVLPPQSQSLDVGETRTEETSFITISYPAIKGERLIAQQAREYIETSRQAFSDEAETGLSLLRGEYPEFADRTYEVHFGAQHFSGNGIESLVVTTYAYTGGANGYSFAASFNQNSDDNSVSLSDIVPENQHEALVSWVQRELFDYEVPELGRMILFEDAINDLTFESFDTFAIDGATLKIYFDEYEVGPGVVGIVEVDLENYREVLARTKPPVIDDIQCYYMEVTDHGNTIRQELSLRFEGNSVTGTKQGSVQGPEYSTGYTGIITGTLEGNRIIAEYAYTIEGNNQRQEERYRIEGHQLIEERYVLAENFVEDILRIDESQKVGEYSYGQVACK